MKLQLDRPRERLVEPGPQHPPHGSKAQWPDLYPGDVAANREDQIGPGLAGEGGPNCRQEGNRLRVHSPQGEGEHAGRRAIQPLEVVHADEDRPLLRQCTERRECPRRHGSLVGGAPARPPPKEGDLQGISLRTRHPLQDRVEDGLEEIAQSRV